MQQFRNEVRIGLANVCFSADKDTSGGNPAITQSSNPLLQKLQERIGGLPSFFTEKYPEHQFAVGWVARNTASGRIAGDVASHLTHPDIGIDYAKLPDAVKEFIGVMSQYQIVLFTSLEKSQLMALRDAGKNGFGADGKTLSVESTLLDLVNDRHHRAWMAARDTATLLGMKVNPHPCHKERQHLTADEIAADNAQVQAYAVILATMPDEHFDCLVARCK